MRKTICVLACLISVAAGVTGEPAAERAEQTVLPGEIALPLHSIVLFSNGVGYFQRAGEVDGNAEVELSFRLQDVNDLLKSLTVQDLDGGSIPSVAYSSRDPLEKTLRSLTIDLTNNPGVAAILTQLRGRDVRLGVRDQNARTGTVIGIENTPGGVVNLLSDDGIRGVVLADVTSVRILDPVVEEELALALHLLGESSGTQDKRVTFSFRGEGTRRVRVGYLLEMPVWKTTYRLVLGEEDVHFLQGWAIVENPTDQDWTDVQLSLVSGRPISFVMDLYRPVYLPRPSVALDTTASAPVQTYEKGRSAAMPSARTASQPPGAESRDMVLGYSGLGAEGGGAMADELDLSQGVRSAATGSQAGEFFQFTIDHPVSLPRQESAMVPIVNGEIRGRRYAIYNPASHATHPYNAVRLENTTGLDLTPGPVTVFDAGIYGGDARIPSLSSGGERLISFSLDLDTSVERSGRTLPPVLTRAWISRSNLHTSFLTRQEQAYTLRYTGTRAREAVIEHPIRAAWKLVQPAETQERSASYYRFLVPLTPGEGARALEIAEETETQQALSLLSASIAQLESFLGRKEVIDSVKMALRGIVERRRTLDDTVAQRKEREAKRSQIHREQARIRENMSKLEKDSDLYKRYVDQLDQQEDQLAAITRRIDELNATERKQREELAKYISLLEIE